MSQNEELFKNFLIKNNIEYHIPTKDVYCINKVPFNKNGIYKPDFYLPQKDLYIEVKGFMTIWTVNKLQYLLKKRLPENFCILQMTEDWWIPAVRDDETLTSAKSKIAKSIAIQFEEIKKLSAKQLHDLSLERLEEYLIVNQKELDKWLELPKKM